MGLAKAILFDIDDTLFPSTEFAEKARRNAVQGMVREGLEGDAEKILAELNAVVKEYGSNYPNHFDALMKKIGAKPDPRIIAAGVAAYHNTKSTIAPFPEVPKTLVALRDKGFRIYAVSEGNPVKQWDKLIRLGLDFLFHGAFITGEMGCEKNEEFYRKIVKRLGLKPSEVTMVGDRVDKDIGPAKKAGLKTARVFQGKYAKEKGAAADFELKKISDVLKIA